MTTYNNNNNNINNNNSNSTAYLGLLPCCDWPVSDTIDRTVEQYAASLIPDGPGQWSNRPCYNNHINNMPTVTHNDNIPQLQQQQQQHCIPWNCTLQLVTKTYYNNHIKNTPTVNHNENILQQATTTKSYPTVSHKNMLLQPQQHTYS